MDKAKKISIKLVKTVKIPVKPAVVAAPVKRTVKKAAADTAESPPRPSRRDLPGTTKQKLKPGEGKNKAGLRVKPGMKPGKAVANPVKVTEPVKPRRSAENSKPAKTNGPAVISKQVKAEKPANTGQPVKTSKPAKVNKPAKAKQPAEVNKPIKASRPVKAIKPAGNNRPAKAHNQDKTRKTVKTDRPVKTSRPVTAKKPALKLPARQTAPAVPSVNIKRPSLKKSAVPPPMKKPGIPPPTETSESSTRLPDRWSDCGQIFYTSGKAFGLANNLRTICLGSRSSVQDFLDNGRLDKGLHSAQKDTLLRIKEENRRPPEGSPPDCRAGKRLEQKKAPGCLRDRKKRRAGVLA